MEPSHVARREHIYCDRVVGKKTSVMSSNYMISITSVHEIQSGSRSRSQYWKLLLVWMSSRICCSSSSSNRPSKLKTHAHTGVGLHGSIKPMTRCEEGLVVLGRSDSGCNVGSTDLGIRALASSAASGHRFAKLANSNLWSFFCSRRLGGGGRIISEH